MTVLIQFVYLVDKYRCTTCQCVIIQTSKNRLHYHSVRRFFYCQYFIFLIPFLLMICLKNLSRFLYHLHFCHKQIPLHMMGF